MRGIALICGVWLVAGCGNRVAGPPPTESADPYTPAMSVRINAVIYSDLPPGRMLEELALLGATTGKPFLDFKAESGIDDWFEEPRADGTTRRISMTCGLSPIVDDEGKITAFIRGRRMVGGRMHPEMPLTP